MGFRAGFEQAEEARVRSYANVPRVGLGPTRRTAAEPSATSA